MRSLLFLRSSGGIESSAEEMEERKNGFDKPDTVELHQFPALAAFSMQNGIRFRNPGGEFNRIPI